MCSESHTMGVLITREPHCVFAVASLILRASINKRSGGKMNLTARGTRSQVQKRCFEGRVPSDAWLRSVPLSAAFTPHLLRIHSAFTPHSLRIYSAITPHRTPSTPQKLHRECKGFIQHLSRNFVNLQLNSSSSAATCGHCPWQVCAMRFYGAFYGERAESVRAQSPSELSAITGLMNTHVFTLLHLLALVDGFCALGSSH